MTEPGGTVKEKLCSRVDYCCRAVAQGRFPPVRRSRGADFEAQTINPYPARRPHGDMAILPYSASELEETLCRRNRR
jgi:hypothetical protein